MPPTPSSRVPSYRLHKTTGLGVVRLNGRDVYLGRHNTPDSLKEYRRVIGEWLASGGAKVPGMSLAGHGQPDCVFVSELVLGYLAFATTYYVKNGRPTGELPNIQDSVKPLVQTHGKIPVTEFGPLALKAVRQAMIDSNLCRRVVNSRINRLRRLFKWGVENQLVPPAVLQGLQAVAPLKRGRCNVRETDPVMPVPDALVDAVIEVAPPQIAAMIELQRLTGMRPGEVVLMRTADIDVTGPIWTYTPAEHKTEHHGRRRVIYIGPKAQRVLAPLLKTDLEAFIFTPGDTMEVCRLAARAARRTPMTPSQRARTRKSKPTHLPGERYTTNSYDRAIVYACDRAFPHPLLEHTRYKKLSPEQRAQVDKWRKQYRWAPNRLRHNAATFLRKQFGIEAARVVLGHKSADVTEIYAERDLSHAAEVMKRVG